MAISALDQARQNLRLFLQPKNLSTAKENVLFALREGFDPALKGQEVQRLKAAVAEVPRQQQALARQIQSSRGLPEGFKAPLTTASNFFLNTGNVLLSGIANRQAGRQTFTRPGTEAKLKGGAQAVLGVGQTLTPLLPSTGGLFQAANIAASTPQPNEQDLRRRFATGLMRAQSQVGTLSPGVQEQRTLNIPFFGSIDPAMTAGGFIGFTQNPINKQFFRLTEFLFPGSKVIFNKGVGQFARSLAKWTAVTGFRGSVEDIILSMKDYPLDGTKEEKLSHLKTNAATGAVSEILGRTVVGSLGKAFGSVDDAIKFSDGIAKISKRISNIGVENVNVRNLVDHEGIRDIGRVKEFERMLARGEELAPILVIKEGNRFGVEDGKHRLQAYKNMGIRDVPVRVLKEFKTTIDAGARLVEQPTGIKSDQGRFRFTTPEELPKAELKAPETVFRATDSVSGKKTLGEGTYFSTNETLAGRFGKNVKQFELDPKAQMLDLRNPDDLQVFSDQAINNNRALFASKMKSGGPDEAMGAVLTKAAKDQGFDGIHGPEDTLGSVVFDKTKLKVSRPGEAGFIDPSAKIVNPLEAVRGKFAEPARVEPATNKLDDAIAKNTSNPTKGTAVEARTQLVDRYAPIEALTKVMRENGKLVAEADPYKRVRLYAGTGNKIARFVTKNMEPLLRGVSNNLDDFRKLLFIERVNELSTKRGINKFPGGITPEDALRSRAEIETRLGADGFKQLTDATDQYHKVMNEALRMYYESGMLSRASYSRILKNNEFYTPFMVAEYMGDNMDNLPIGRKSISVANENVIKQLRGSEKDIVDPLESSMRHIAKLITTAERNSAASTFKNLVGDVEGVRYRQPNEVLGLDEGSISFFEDGVKKEIVVPKDVAEAAKGMNAQSADLITGFMRKFSGVLRAGATTYNVGFLVPNMIRDVTNARVVAKNGLTMGNWLKGMMSAMKQDELYDEWIKAGGGGGGMADIAAGGQRGIAKLSGTESLGRKAVTKPVDLLKRMGQVSEESTRLGMFRQARAAGETPMEAAFQAREGTVDFSKAGTKLKVVNMWVPFLNARTQGTINLFKALNDRPMHAGSQIAAIVGVPAVATYLWNRQFRDWNDISQYEKDNNFIIMGRDRTDEERREGKLVRAVKIPKGDVGKIFGNPLEYFLAWVDGGKNNKSLAQLTVDILGEVSPVGVTPRDVVSSVLPPPAKATVETTTNTNLFTGLPIEPEFQSGVQREYIPESERVQRDTGKTARLVGQVTGKFGLSPADLENITHTMTGGLGRQALTLSDAVLGEPPKSVGEIPLARRFIGAKGGEGERAMFERAKEQKTEEERGKLEARKTAEFIIDSVKDMDGQQRKVFLNQNQELLTEPVIKQIEKVQKERRRMTTGFGGVQRYSRAAMSVRASSSTNAGRAKFIINEVKNMSREQRLQFLKELQQDELLTEGLIKEIARQMRTT